MSQRVSGYRRKADDQYETPAWVTEALLPYLRPCRKIWEPAAGAGKMVAVLERVAKVKASDITTGMDFLAVTKSNAALALTSAIWGKTGNV
jgi:hypothetical protein